MVAHLHICKFSIFRKIYLHMYNFQAKLIQPLALCILTAFFFFFLLTAFLIQQRQYISVTGKQRW